MELKITVDDLKDKKLFIATPMYGGQCAGMYTKSTNDLAMACTRYGIDIRFYYLFNESLITRARNYCVDEFLRSGYEYLLFIDSDIGFSYKDVFTLMYLTDPKQGRDVVTGPYPKKAISWEKIKRAVDSGIAEDNPFILQNFVGDFVFNPAENISTFRIDEPIEIREGGTGFMCIHRDTLVKYAEAYPELKYLPDHARTEHFDGTREITAFFDCIIEPETRRYLSEDYMFSYNARKAGLKIWMCPWMQLEHIGSYVFTGSMAAMAAIQASPTATKESNQKHWLTKKEQNDNMDKDESSDEPNRKARRIAKKLQRMK